MTKNLPTLFIRNISKNTSKEVIWNTMANLGFGTISNVITNLDGGKPTAIVYYEYWNMDQTEYIRRMLASNKTLNISYDYESPTWIVSQYDDTFTTIAPLSNVIKHRKIKKDTRCYAPKKAVREKTYVIDDNLRRNLFPFPELD
jgi:hypothetical protein